MALEDAMIMLNPRRAYKQLAANNRAGNATGGGVRSVALSLCIRHDACGPVWGHSADNKWAAIKVFVHLVMHWHDMTPQAFVFMNFCCNTFPR